MRFNEIIQNQLEISDDIIEEYISETNEENFSVDNFLDFLNDRYYMSDFIEFEDWKYTLKKDYFLDELNRVKEQMNND